MILCHCIQYRNEIIHMGKTGTNTDYIRKETFSSITANIFPVQETPWNSNITLGSSLEAQYQPAHRCLSFLLALFYKAAFVHSCHKSKRILMSFVGTCQYFWHQLSSPHCLWAFCECSPAHVSPLLRQSPVLRTRKSGNKQCLAIARDQNRMAAALCMGM